MKKLFTILFVSLISFSLSHATVHQVTVANNVFIPADFAANVGDTIIWTWKAGTHTTTSTTVPAGAASWDAAIDENHTSFTYIIEQTGLYDYSCAIHANMTARFTALTPTGFNQNESELFLRVHLNSSDELKVELNSPKNGMMNLHVYNIIGREMKVLVSSQQSAGSYEFTCNISDLARGIYLVKLSVGNMNVVKKVILE